MLKLPRIHLPEEFVQLLSMNTNASVEAPKVVEKFLRDRPGYRRFLEEKFIEFDEKKRVEHIVKSLGWEGFRDRLASLYLDKAKFGKYPISTSPELARELAEFEQRVLPNSVEGHHRSFLLAFYLKIIKLEMYRQNPTEDYVDLSISANVIDLLALSKTRMVKVDWLLLGLMHYHDFFGFEELKKILLKDGFKYNDLFQKLELQQQKRLTENFISYAYATHDIGMITDPIIH